MAPVSDDKEKALAPELDAILEKIRSEEGPVRKAGFQALLRMGVDKAVGALLERVVEPGKTDDSPARIALHGLAAYTTCPCAEGPRHCGQYFAPSPSTATIRTSSGAEASPTPSPAATTSARSTWLRIR